VHKSIKAQLLKKLIICKIFNILSYQNKVFGHCKSLDIFLRDGIVINTE